jgi:hypothetical protein
MVGFHVVSPRTAFAVGLVFLLCVGCATNPRLRVVNKAREYVLSEHPELSEESLHIIKFTKPELRQDMIFMAELGGENKNDFTQTCVVWDMPKKEYDGKQMVVVGFGQRDLWDWYPVRAFIKRYRELEPPKSNTRKKSSRGRKKMKKKKVSGTLDVSGAIGGDKSK